MRYQFFFASFNLLLMSCFAMASVLAEEAIENTAKSIRLATLNASLYANAAGKVAERIQLGNDVQAKSIAAIIQKVRPDVLLINEIDHEVDARTVKLFRDQYLSVSHEGSEAISYPFIYSAPSNTGVDSELDLNRNERRGEPDDAWGYGIYPGQYSFAVLSRYPIDVDAIRTFQTFCWAKLPAALRPIDPQSQQPYHADEVWNSLRLSSKNHVDLPVQIDGHVLHVLASHPTPPVFDGPEDRNGCRNHDEILFWKHYIDGESALVDDSGKAGGLSSAASFVLMGDLNSDPNFGNSRPEAIRALLQHPRITDPLPRRISSAEATPIEAANDTADFGSVGELRVDYVLPSRNLRVLEAKVFWPASDDATSKWIHASDHRLVWIDAIISESPIH